MGPLWHRIVESIDVLMRFHGSREKDLTTRRIMIGGNPFLAREQPWRWISRDCRNDNCKGCPGPAHDLDCTHLCHYWRDYMPKTFEARFDGYCRECQSDIYAGDDISYNFYDEIICHECTIAHAKETALLEKAEREKSAQTDWRKKIR